jgi:hypothetical protein
MPYTEDILPIRCREGVRIYNYYGPIIYMGIVEFHLPFRAARQRGRFQEVPPTEFLVVEERHEAIHSRALPSRELDEFVGWWNNRLDNVWGAPVVGVVPPANEYWTWYFQHTVQFITNPLAHNADAHGSAEFANVLV